MLHVMSSHTHPALTSVQRRLVSRSVPQCELMFEEVNVIQPVITTIALVVFDFIDRNYYCEISGYPILSRY